MKMSRRILATILCLALVLSLAVVAYAASSTFVTGTRYGYRYNARGTISGLTATAKLSATAISGEVSIPSSDCSGDVWVLVFIDETNVIASAHNTGTLSTTATSTVTQPIYKTYSTFEFTGLDLGGYRLYNS